MKHLTSKLWLALCWLSVLVLAGLLRFEDLAERPFHFDEATGARITSDRIDPAEGYQFNPVHNHGPLLSAAAAPLCRARGEGEWKDMTKGTLRLVPAIAGTLLVLLPILWRRRFGDVPVLAAAALLATSPLLAYYSRMFIHEMLVALLGLLAVLVAFAQPRCSLTLKSGLIGVVIGLMFATKETFAISIIAWTAAAGLLVLANRGARKRLLQPANWKEIFVEWRNPALAFAIGAGLSAGWYYTNGLRNPGGVWDAVRTFFVYETTEGHDKPFLYYLGMLVVPTKGGIWWHEGLVFLLAVVSVVRSFLPGRKGEGWEIVVRFVALSAIFHILIYSIISYKTPWLMCLPWAYVCVLAGLGFRGFVDWKPLVRVAAVLVLAGVLFQQQRVAKFAVGRFASDARTPYAYAPTSRDVESVREWTGQLAEVLPPRALEPIAVVGREFWPLPWYLRDFEAIGYWPEPHPDVADCPLVFAMPETANEVSEMLKGTHIALPRTLRSEVPVMLYLRNDHWEHWMAPEPLEESGSP